MNLYPGNLFGHYSAHLQEAQKGKKGIPDRSVPSSSRGHRMVRRNRRDALLADRYDPFKHRAHRELRHEIVTTYTCI